MTIKKKKLGCGMWLKMRRRAEVDCKALCYVGEFGFDSAGKGETLWGNTYLATMPWINTRDREEGKSAKL